MSASDLAVVAVVALAPAILIGRATIRRRRGQPFDDDERRLVIGTSGIVVVLVLITRLPDPQVIASCALIVMGAYLAFAGPRDRRGVFLPALGAATAVVGISSLVVALVSR